MCIDILLKIYYVIVKFVWFCIPVGLKLIEGTTPLVSMGL